MHSKPYDQSLPVRKWGSSVNWSHKIHYEIGYEVSTLNFPVTGVCYKMVQAGQNTREVEEQNSMMLHH